MKGKIVWVGRVGDTYELGRKENWCDFLSQFQGPCEIFRRNKFESITGFKLKPGEGPIAVRISVKRVGKKSK